jgi:hypothetical protein
MADPTTGIQSSTARDFRTRFRVPFVIYERIVAWTKTWDVTSEVDICDRSCIPTGTVLR